MAREVVALCKGKCEASQVGAPAKHMRQGRLVPHPSISYAQAHHIVLNCTWQGDAGPKHTHGSLAEEVMRRSGSWVA